MTDDRLTRTLTALAGPPPDTDAAWAELTARLEVTPSSGSRARRHVVVAAAGLGAAAATVVGLVLAGIGDDDARTTTVVPADGDRSATTPSTAEAPAELPSVPLVLSRGNALELWDGTTNQYVSRIGSAGEGRRITEVSVAGATVAYTLTDRVTGQSSIWLLDLDAGDTPRQIAAVGRHPALTPDATTLVYVRSVQEIEVVDLATGAERNIGPLFPADDYRFEWSPSGARLLMEAGGAISVYDESADGTSTVTRLFGLHGAATWVDDTTVFAETVDGWVQYDTTTAVAEPDNSLVEPALVVAANPRGMVATLVEDDTTNEDGDRLDLPGGTDVDDVVAFDW